MKNKTNVDDEIEIEVNALGQYFIHTLVYKELPKRFADVRGTNQLGFLFSPHNAMSNEYW